MTSRGSLGFPDAQSAVHRSVAVAAQPAALPSFQPRPTPRGTSPAASWPLVGLDPRVLGGGPMTPSSTPASLSPRLASRGTAAPPAFPSFPTSIASGEATSDRGNTHAFGNGGVGGGGGGGGGGSDLVGSRSGGGGSSPPAPMPSRYGSSSSLGSSYATSHAPSPISPFSGGFPVISPFGRGSDIGEDSGSDDEDPELDRQQRRQSAIAAAQVNLRCMRDECALDPFMVQPPLLSRQKACMYQETVHLPCGHCGRLQETVIRY